jgi:uncharacterized UPF0160 family protein
VFEIARRGLEAQRSQAVVGVVGCQFVHFGSGQSAYTVQTYSTQRNSADWLIHFFTCLAYFH